MAKDGGWEDLFSPLNDDEAMPSLLGETGSVPSLFPELPDPVLEATPLERPAPDADTDSGPDAPVAPIAFTAPVVPSAAAEPPAAEPAVPSEPAQPVEPAEPVAPPVDPSAVMYAALQEDVEAESAKEQAAAAAESAPASDVEQAAAAVAATGLTRRELRERREAAGETGAIDTAQSSDTAPSADTVPPADTAPPADAVEQPVTEPFTPVFDTSADVAATAEPDAPVVEPVAESAPWDPAPELAADAPDAGADTPAAAPRVDAPTIPVAYDTVAPAAAAGGAGGGEPPRRGFGGGFPLELDPPPPAKRRMSLRWLAWFIPVVLVLGGLAYGANYAWQNYEDQVRELLGMEIPIDYDGTGNGEEVVVTINQGDTGTIIARKLHDAEVTMTWDAFYNLMIELANAGGEPAIQFGNFRLEKEMSAQAALNALLDPANKIVNNLYIPEGTYIFQVLDIMSSTTGIPLEELQVAVADPSVYGAANPAGTLEGYLAPDTYHLDGTEDATSLIQRLVDTTFARLDSLGVAPEDRHRILTMASVVQRESGPVAGDPAKVARVFYNREEQGMRWESDATVSYGAGNFSSIWNSQAMFDDASNMYNTYYHPGFPIGPIAAPSMVAIEAAVAPADGPWLFFVPVDLRTGETHFSETADEHQSYVNVLLDWCNASDENASYCQ